MQRLIIRLGSQLNDPIQWLVYSAQEQEIIASGTLNSANDLNSLSDRASSSQIIALAPASDIFFTLVELPKNASRKALSAVPFMIEEELCGDIDTLFFAMGKKSENTQEVAVVKKSKLERWQQAFADADLYCETLIPDAYCLPSNSDISLVEIDNQLLVKYEDGRIMQGESEWLLPLILDTAQTCEANLTCYSEIENWPDTLEANFNFDQLPMQLLLDGGVDTALNLFQGEYTVKRKLNPTWEKWKVAAALAVIAVGANLVYKTTELNSLKAQRAEIRQDIQAAVKQGFPELKRVTRVRTVLTREIAKLEQNGGNASMLAMLSRLGNAFESSGVKPQTIRYDSKRSEIRMQSVAASFEALESFSRNAESLGFEVEQGSINNRGSEVVGVITVRG